MRAIDAAGNDGAATAPVPVTLPTDPVALYSDDFTAANGAGWNSAWATSSGNGAVTTQDNAGVLSFTDTSGAYARAALTGVAPVTDAEVLTSYRWSANTPMAYLSVYLRGSGGWQNSYRPQNGFGIELRPNSTAVRAVKNVNGTLTDLGGLSGVQATTTGKQWLRMRVSGDTIRVKIWADGQAEPDNWEFSVTDSSVSGPGQLHISLNRSSSNSGAKAVTLDDLAVIPT